MSLVELFQGLARALDGPLAIEKHARDALRTADTRKPVFGQARALPDPILAVMAQPTAHPVCRVIEGLPFAWAPPQTSPDPLYEQHSTFKAHVEILGPGGVIKSDSVRIGLYGMLPDREYGIRTHPAEEIYLMLAGRAFWKRGDAQYVEHGPGERSYHPSMMKHASRTAGLAFLSVYVWHGDISTRDYVYEGLPTA